MIRIGVFISLICFVIACGFSAWGWLATPEGAQVPVHFDLSGEPDRYGSKTEAFLMMPAFLLGLAFLMSIVPRIDPRGDNVRRSRPVFLAGWIIGAVVIAGAQGFITWSALGGALPPDVLARGTGLLVAGVMLILGLVIARARPNFFVGVRTPWTLSSDLSWDKTHRWASRIYLVFGTLGLVALFLLPPAQVTVALLGVLIASALGLVVYSWWVWKNDSKRETLSPDDA